MITQTQRIEIMRKAGKTNALALQADAPELDGTALNERMQDIPSFAVAKAVKNMLDRPIGFVCKSSAGRVVRLIQPYDSETYPGEPETLPAQWGFAWSKEPAHALPFVALSTSPYMVDDCCIDGGKAYRSKMDNNVFSPGYHPAGWEEIEI